MVAQGSLDEWCDRLQTEEAALEEYIETVHARDERDVKALLRLQLVHSGTFELFDKVQFEIVRRQYRDGTISPILLGREHTRRLILRQVGKVAEGPWEGITWVLDCLPHSPADALSAIGAYVYAHAQELPDGAITRRWCARR